ncbi:tRNA lysidine(34) synthetase TilS [Bartonella sp. WD16.2]|uniref:tRNA lysidine(34) synthetase TilS n=1 Tax=Bartonella sp. WD16.2 TaxID=1933904 RepID=UPI00099A98B7|nr:tRNA lysidine(34) synthetase TilS [Bartonella sp. WD16.2]AQX20403.1 tRNA(Ile)-lysidine synthase [Bartonella sp. WD16.2]
MLIQLEKIFKKSDFAHCQKLIVAVSGGGDSLALLFLLRDYFKTLLSPPEIIVVTIDHQLREESACEAQKVAEICRAYQIKHVIVRWEGTKPKTDISQKARVARYDLLFQEAEKQGATLIMTGHTLNDQVETYYMRYQRILKDGAVLRGGQEGDGASVLRLEDGVFVGVAQGGEIVDARCGIGAAGVLRGGQEGDYSNTWEEMGVTDPLKDTSVLKDNGELIERGLSCIAREALLRRKVRLIRPLLDVKRDILRAYLRLRGIEWIDDPTNDDLRFERVRVRRSIHPKNFSKIAQKVNEAALKRRQYAQMIADLILALDIVVEYGRCFIKRPAPFLRHHPGFPFVVGLFAVLMGGSPYLLASQKLSTLNQKLCLHSLEKKRFTLARSLIEYSQKGIALWREARNVQKAIILPGQTLLWDGRYQITNREADALKVCAADLVHLKQFFRYGKQFSNTHMVGDSKMIEDMIDFGGMVDRKRLHFPSLQSLPLVLGAKGIDIPELSHFSCRHKVIVQRILAPFDWLLLREDAVLINVVEPFFNIR